MGLSPWSRGDTDPDWLLKFQPDSSGTFDITGLLPADFTLVLLDVCDPVERLGTGTFSNLTAASGSNPASILYAPSSVDVGTLGKFDLRVVVKKGHATQQRTFKMSELWEVRP